MKWEFYTWQFFLIFLTSRLCESQGTSITIHHYPLHPSTYFLLRGGDSTGRCKKRSWENLTKTPSINLCFLHPTIDSKTEWSETSIPGNSFWSFWFQDCASLKVRGTSITIHHYPLHPSTYFLLRGGDSTGRCKKRSWENLTKTPSIGLCFSHPTIDSKTEWSETSIPGNSFWSFWFQDCASIKVHPLRSINIHYILPHTSCCGAETARGGVRSEVGKTWQNSFHRPLLLAPYHWQQNRMKWEFYTWQFFLIFLISRLCESQGTSITIHHYPLHPSTYVLRGRDSTVRYQKLS